MYLHKLIRRRSLLLILLCFLTCYVHAQTEIDGAMMAKGLLCTGPMYSYTSWDHYWEGTWKRTNLNLGTVSAQTFSYMGNYGITKKLNVIFSVPYVKTNASAGTLHGMQGWQDASLYLKWRPVRINAGGGKFSLTGVAGYSTPLSNYTPDFMPLSIGMHSTSLQGRIIADYQRKKLFATVSGNYTYRNNIKLDRAAYYTTEMHYTNEVQMPDMASFNFRTGFRSKNLIAEAVLNTSSTLGGFDITRNNSPFASNRINMTMAGFNIRYVPKPLPDLTLNTGADYTLAGRNAGQSTTVYGGAYYIFHFNRKSSVTPQP